MNFNSETPTRRVSALAMTVVLVAVSLAAGCRQETSTTNPNVGTSAAGDLLGDESGNLLSESWEAHFVRGAKVGYRRTRVFQAPQGGEALQRVETVDRLEMKRFGDVAQQELICVTLEDATGRVLQLAYEVNNGDVVERGAGQIEGGRLTFWHARADDIESRTFNWTEANGGPFAIERSLRRQPMLPGEVRTVEAFLPLLDRVVQLELTAGEREPVELDGEQKQLLKIVSKDKLATGWSIPTMYWVNEAGEIQKTHEGFLDRVTLRTTEPLAKRPNDLARLDLGLNVGVPLERAFENPHQSTHAVYRVKLDGLNPNDVFATSLSQQVIPSGKPGDDFALLTVDRISPESPAEVELDLQRPTTADTAPNRWIQSDDRRVVAIADAVAGSVDDPWRAALALEQYLYRRISKTDFSQVFSSAAEVAESGKGDCSEHAVLLAATCRARGIPARVTIGLLYSPVDQRFLYHMWNEVWIKDRWIPLDATLGKGGIGAAHLKFCDSSLAQESAYSMVSPVIFLIGKLQIELVEATHG